MPLLDNSSSSLNFSIKMSNRFSDDKTTLFQRCEIMVNGYIFWEGNAVQYQGGGGGALNLKGKMLP